MLIAGPLDRYEISMGNRLVSRSEPRAVPPLYRSVHDIYGPLPRQHPTHLTGRSRLKPDQRLLAVPGNMGSKDHILPPAQRARVGKRLGVGCVERAAGDLFCVARADPGF